jgi:hypothetical protein
MKAELLLDERQVLAENLFVELVVWRLPESARGSKHRFKYRMALVADGECVLRFDNEAGKGDHCHIGKRERSYTFYSSEKLIEDFWSAVDAWRRK